MRRALLTFSLIIAVFVILSGSACQIQAGETTAATARLAHAG
jgi:hypothetical protein